MVCCMSCGSGMIKSDFRIAQEKDGVVYPDYIPECVTLYANDKRLHRPSRFHMPNIL